MNLVYRNELELQKSPYLFASPGAAGYKARDSLLFIIIYTHMNLTVQTVYKHGKIYGPGTGLLGNEKDVVFIYHRVVVVIPGEVRTRLSNCG